MTITGISSQELQLMSLEHSGISVIPNGLFRLFDAVDVIAPADKSDVMGCIRTKGNLARAADIFTAHFPGRPIIPGMILVDQLFQLAGLYAAAHGIKGRGYADEFSGGKFLKPVTPDTMEVRFEVDIHTFRIGRMRTKVHGVGRVYADGEPAVTALEVKVYIIQS